MRRTFFQATCHPERPHEAKGLCKACASAAWRAANKEKIAIQRPRLKDYHRVWYAANKEQQNLQSRAWYAAHKDKSTELQREKARARIRLYRARKRGAVGSITSDQWAAIKAAYAWQCAYCGKKSVLTQDHVIPLVLGGSHTPANIVPACRACNSSKGARQPTRLPAKRLLI